jgi:hypothetical protein
MVLYFFAALRCPALVTPPQAMLYATSDPDPDGRYGYPVTITTACDLGHTLVGMETIKCLPNGTWSAGLPTCHGM